MNKTFFKLVTFIVLVTVLSVYLWKRQPEEGSSLNDAEEDIVEQSESIKDTLTSLNGEKEDEAPKGQLEQLVVGEDYFLVLYDDGTVWGWGNNAEGKLGTTKSFVSEPQKIEGLEGIIKLEDGGSNVFALDDQGNVYTWGQKEGVVHTIPKDYSALLYKPMIMEDFKEVVNITARNERLYALNADGELYVSDLPWARKEFHSFFRMWEMWFSQKRILYTMLRKDCRRSTYWI